MLLEFDPLDLVFWLLLQLAVAIVTLLFTLVLQNFVDFLERGKLFGGDERILIRMMSTHEALVGVAQLCGVGESIYTVDLVIVPLLEL